MTIDDRVGRIIDGRYELLERIGEGAMGAVYRAHQQVVDREVAVKLLHGEVAADSDYRTRFEREAKALGKLDHPGCVRVHDFGWWKELEAPFLVAEFVHGDPMHQRIGGLSVERTVQYGLAIAEAMQHAHDQGIIHRDLKPENVIVRSPPDADALELKVVDFGLARMPADEEVRLTQAGDAYGTPAYMSPEQCQADEGVGPAADVYALGCMLWEMLHDRLPFQANKASAMMIKHVTSPVPEVTRDVPAALADIVRRMMAKSPDARPTMADVVGVLDGLQIGGDEAENPAESGEEGVSRSFSDDLDPRGNLATANTKQLPGARAPESTELDAALTRSTTSLPLAAGAVLLVAALAGVWFFTRDKSAPPPTREPAAEVGDRTSDAPDHVVARQANDSPDPPSVPAPEPPAEDDPSGDDAPADDPSGEDDDPASDTRPTDRRPVETEKAEARPRPPPEEVDEETPDPDPKQERTRDSVDLRY